MDAELKEKFKKIKLLVTDFDGVMTDGYVYIGQDGAETARCSRKDGLGIELLKNAGIGVAVISKEGNGLVAARCRKLGIDCWQKVYDGGGKLQILKQIAEDKKFSLAEVAYMGDDLNDKKALEAVGLAITVADGHEQLKSISHFVTSAKGGEHAVREVCEAILESKGIELSL